LHSARLAALGHGLARIHGFDLRRHHIVRHAVTCTIGLKVCLTVVALNDADDLSLAGQFAPHLLLPASKVPVVVLLLAVVIVGRLETRPSTSASSASI
jgi:hypothetical protein